MLRDPGGKQLGMALTSYGQLHKMFQHDGIENVQCYLQTAIDPEWYKICHDTDTDTVVLVLTRC
jgi:hypothetical protein